MERTEISAFFLTLFVLAGAKILHFDKNCICRCTISHDGVQNGARIKSISPRVDNKEKRVSNRHST